MQVASSKTTKFFETSSIYWAWQRQARSNSVRLPSQKWKLLAPKQPNSSRRPQFFALDNVNNEAILLDIPQKWDVECKANGLVPMSLFFFHSISLCHEKVMPGHTKWCTRHGKNHFGKPDSFLLQNTTHFSKSAPLPLNMFAGYVPCTAPATRNNYICSDPVRTSHACHRVWNCCKTHTLESFCAC